MTPGEVWVIANPVAGAGRPLAHAGSGVSALLAAGLAARLAVPESGRSATDVAARAVASGARAVVACGGDGTVHDVLQAMVGTGIPMGFWPAGSGDDVAAAMGQTPTSPADCASRLVYGLAQPPRAVDVGHVTAADGAQSYFGGVLSTGFDSAVNERANRMPRLGGQRYNIAMVRELGSFRPQEFTVVVDGVRTTDRAMLVAIGNGGQYGGGMRVCPDAQIDDGLLDLTWLRAVPIPTFLRLFPSVYSGTHVRSPYVRTMRGAQLRVEAADQVAYADGERVGPLPITARAIPGGLIVLAAP